MSRDGWGWLVLLVVAATLFAGALSWGIGHDQQLDDHDTRLDRLESTTTAVVRSQAGEPSPTTVGTSGGVRVRLCDGRHFATMSAESAAKAKEQQECP